MRWGGGLGTFLALPALAQDTGAALDAAERVGDNILREGGVLSYVLALLLAAAIAALLYMLWRHDRDQKRTIVAIKRDCQQKLDAKDAEMAALKARHADELYTLTTQLAAMNTALANFRSGLERLYDLGKARDDKAGDHLVNQVKAWGKAAETINAFPNATEIIVGRLLDARLGRP